MPRVEQRKGLQRSGQARRLLFPALRPKFGQKARESSGHAEIAERDRDGDGPGRERHHSRALESKDTRHQDGA